VIYGQVSDIQHIAVDLLTESKPKILKDLLKTCSFFLDEADHVLTEQAKSLLYIASPCPSYYTLHGLYFHIQYRIDYEGNFSTSEVKNRAAIQQKAQTLTELLLQCFRDFEKDNHKVKSLHPNIIDLDVFASSSASGAMSARFKRNGKEYVIETTSEKDHHGTIANVRRITIIIDISTGVESDGTRWTTEAPPLEAMEGLPVGGSDPLAFYSAFPYILTQVRYFAGITGTVGGADNLNFYGKTYDVWSIFRIPRNKPTTIYRLPTQVAATEDHQVKNIGVLLQRWIENQMGIPTHGPALIIAESIQKAQKIMESLQPLGHRITEPDIDDSVPSANQTHDTTKAPEEKKEVKWKCDSSEGCPSLSLLLPPTHGDGGIPGLRYCGGVQQGWAGAGPETGSPALPPACRWRKMPSPPPPAAR